MKQHKELKKELKKAFKNYKEIKKTKDKKLIHNSLCWIIATCEAYKAALKEELK